MDRLKLGVLIAVNLAALIGSVILAVLTAGTDQILHRLLHPRTEWIILLIGAQLLAYVGYSLAYRSVFSLRWRIAARHTFYGFSPLAALGGFIYDAGIDGRRGQPKVVTLGIIEYLVLAPAVWAAAVYALAAGLKIPSSLTLPWIVGLPAGGLAAAAALGWRAKLPVRFNRAINGLLSAFNRLGIVGWTGAIYGTAVYWIGELVVLAAALRLFSAHLNTAALIITYATGYVLTRRSLPAGMVGLTVIFMMLVLHWLGINYGAAFLATYSYLVVNLVLPMSYLIAIKR